MAPFFNTYSFRFEYTTLLLVARHSLAFADSLCIFPFFACFVFSLIVSGWCEMVSLFDTTLKLK